MSNSDKYTRYVVIGIAILFLAIAPLLGLFAILFDNFWEYGTYKKLTNKLYEIVHKYEGSFSAEHGIGQLRKESLKKHKNSVAYSIMISIKKQLDPKGIMNPGKVL